MTKWLASFRCKGFSNGLKGSSPMSSANIKKITSNQNVKEVICIPQVENIEDELKRSCNVRKAWDILGSTSRSEFKKDIITEKNLAQKLKQKNFAIDKIWILNPSGIFEKYSSEGFRVKY